MTFDGQLGNANAVVVGASGAFGSRIAEHLAVAGARLTLVGRRSEALSSTAASVPDDRVRRLIADLRDPVESDQVISTALKLGESIDIVVNAMGVVAFGNVTDLDSDTIEELFLSNTFAAMFLARAALPAMTPGGTIASISGVIAEQNMPGMAAYGASKAALQSFNEGFGREARRAKVRVLDIRPPHTETGLADRAIAGTAPKFPVGLDPDIATDIIVRALADDSIADLPSSAFA